MIAAVARGIAAGKIGGSTHRWIHHGVRARKRGIDRGLGFKSAARVDRWVQWKHRIWSLTLRVFFSKDEDICDVSATDAAAYCRV